MIITKKTVARRTFLRGMGVSLSLPLLDAMVPPLTAMAQTPARPVRRFGVFCRCLDQVPDRRPGARRR
jgi:hypothetical protein